MNKPTRTLNLYIKEVHHEIIDRAKVKARSKGLSLSSVIISLLEQWVSIE